MSVREILFAVAVAVALSAVVRGVFMLNEPAAWITSGLSLAGWSWLVLGGDDK